MSADFSVIIPSRNRPALLRAAIDSVLAQRHPSKEIIVVDDGSDGDAAALYRQMEEELAGQVTFLHLIYRPRGHGQSYAINFGASRATGDYICMLDDDDSWIDSDHLSRAHAVITAASGMVDVYFTNQRAYSNGNPVENRTIWIENLTGIVARTHAPDPYGAYFVTSADLLKAAGFGHLNTTIVRQDLFRAIGGLDENIRYECDRDFYLRVIDRARHIKYHPATTSRHNIPDQSKSANMSTLVNDIEKRFFQLTVLNKSALMAEHSEIRQHCRTNKPFALKKIAELLRARSHYSSAAYFAREALAIGFSFKWLLFTIYLSARAAWRELHFRRPALSDGREPLQPDWSCPIEVHPPAGHG
jgi:glycosyltransferase involved in cell wall biosynthesis